MEEEIQKNDWKGMHCAILKTVKLLQIKAKICFHAFFQSCWHWHVFPVEGILKIVVLWT